MDDTLKTHAENFAKHADDLRELTGDKRGRRRRETYKAPPTTVDIEVTTPNGRRHVFSDINPECTNSNDLKDMIHKSLSIHPQYQRLIYNGRPLCDSIQFLMSEMNENGVRTDSVKTLKTHLDYYGIKPRSDNDRPYQVQIVERYEGA